MEAEIEQIEAQLKTAFSKVESVTVPWKKDFMIKLDKLKLLTLAFIASNLRDFPVEVKDSPKHGRGVFATSTIKKGDLVTLYPGDIVTLIPIEGEEECEMFCKHSLRMTKEIKIKELGIYTKYLSEYCFEIDNHHSIIGYPSFEDNSAYLGHLINDAIFGNFRDLTPEAYLDLSTQSRNCEIKTVCENKIVAVIATQDIEPGVELLTTYGIAFWTKYCNKKGIRWYPQSIVNKQKKTPNRQKGTSDRQKGTSDKQKKTPDKQKKTFDNLDDLDDPNVVVTLFEGELFTGKIYNDTFYLDVKGPSPIKRTAAEKLQIFKQNLTLFHKFFVNKIEKVKFKRSDGKMIELDEAKNCFMMFILPPVLDIHVELRPSPKHGRGVFATKDLEKGSILTLYPCDIVNRIIKGKKFDKNHHILPNISNRMLQIIKKDEARDFSERYWDYSVNVDSSYSICANPNFDDNPQYLGHFINDGFMGDFSILTPSLYNELSTIKSNCYFEAIVDRCIVVAIANRPIMAGEELFASYGILFWEVYNRKHNILAKF